MPCGVLAPDVGGGGDEDIRGIMRPRGEASNRRRRTLAAGRFIRGAQFDGNRAWGVTWRGSACRRGAEKTPGRPRVRVVPSC
jgi:hypothetical protein